MLRILLNRGLNRFEPALLIGRGRFLFKYLLGRGKLTCRFATIALLQGDLRFCQGNVRTEPGIGRQL